MSPPNVVILDIFDTYDVMNNWSISLLPPIVLDNLFAINIFDFFPIFPYIDGFYE